MEIVSPKGTKYEVVIGLEIHAQIKSNAKLFSKSPNDWESAPNTNISLFDIALPGTLPVLNRDILIHVIRSGIAINGHINNKSYFDRKHYFYPDLPSGYQITQFYKPIVENGYVDIEVDGVKKRIRVERIHIEQDAGKSLHDVCDDKTCVDFNRAGVGLMEIVSAPDLRSPQEAAIYIKKVRGLLKAVNSSFADMEKGTFRCDANVSVMKLGSTKFGNRCEIKNLNSIRFLTDAIEYEARRHIDIIESGGFVEQETRLFDTASCETRSMRKKEDATDYRYFPDPDLPVCLVSEEMINEVQNSMPELPDGKLDRYLSLGFNKKDITFLLDEPELSDFFDSLLKKYEPKLCYTWFIVELLGRLKKSEVSICDSGINIEIMSDLIDAISKNKINGRSGKIILDELVAFKSGSVAQIIQNKNLEQVDNTAEIITIINNILSTNSDKVTEYKAGKERLFGFFVGEAMKVLGQNSNPKAVSDLLKKALEDFATF